MDKRYQVFVSSTYEDLQEERRQTMQALLALDCIPTGMELFPAADDDSWTIIKRFIAACDYYVLIIGGRYGTRARSGLSYTEMEYEYAIEAGVPVLAFLHKSPQDIPSGKAEPTEAGRMALEKFRQRIEGTRHAKYWHSASDLSGEVVLAMAHLMKIKPRVGWIRANLAPDESAAQEILRLRRRIDELEAAAADSNVRAPLGTEALAQGDETFTCHFDYEVANKNGYFNGSQDLTWNDIISLLGPMMIGQSSEGGLKEKLSEAFSNRYFDRHRTTVYSVSPRDEDFQKIKLQLRALGLIREVRSDSPKGRNETRWSLTSYGDHLMTQVAAIRSSRPADSEHGASPKKAGLSARPALS